METKEIICPKCGGILETIEGVKVITCKHCNTDFDVEKAEEKKEHQKVKKEKVFYDKGGIIVTNTRIKLPDKIYSTANITSLSKKVIPKNYSFPIGLIIIGAVLSLFYIVLAFADIPSSCATLLVIGLILIVVGIGILASSKAKYCVVFETASGKIDVLTTVDEKMIDDIVEAISRAIDYRG